MHVHESIYLVTDHPSDFRRYATAEYQTLATFLKEEALTLTSYETMKAMLAQRLGTTVEVWAMGGMTYIGVELIQGTTALPFVVPEWHRVYRLVTLPEGTTELPEDALLIPHWRSLPDDHRLDERQALTGERAEGDGL